MGLCPQLSAMRLIVAPAVPDRWRTRDARARPAGPASTCAGAAGAREDEPEVAGAFRQRHQQLVHFRGDPHVVDDRHPPCRVEAGHAAGRRRGAESESSSRRRPASPAPSLPGDSPSACRSSSSSSEMAATVPGSPLPVEPQRAGAQAADRPRGHFEHEDARLVHATLGVNRSVAQAEGARRLVDRGGRSRAARPQTPSTASRRWSPRRTDRRADRACRRSPARAARRGASAPSSANSRPSMKPSTSTRSRVSLALGPHVRRIAAGPAAGGKRRRALSRSSTRITPRLPDSASGLTTQGNETEAASSRGSIAIDIGRNQGTGRPSGTQTLARQQLVARGRGCGGGMTRQPEPFLHARRDHRRPIADGEHAVKRTRPGQLENRPRRRRLVREPDGNRPVPPRILEHVAAIGREHQIDAETLGRLTERARLISGRRGEEKNSWHEHSVTVQFVSGQLEPSATRQHSRSERNQDQTGV